MKLPSIETSPVQPLNAGTTPGQEVQVQQAKTRAITGLGQGVSDAYKGISAVSLSNAQTATKKEYASQWGDFASSDTVSVQQLEEMGVEYDPNLAYLTSAGPGGEEAQNASKVIPTWAVASQYHAKLVQNLKDKNTPTATEAARMRYQSDFDLEYATERQSKVEGWANEQRLNYQRKEIETNVGDLLELGDYGGALQAANLGKAAGVLDDHMYKAITDGVMEIKERSGYVDVIENGSMREKADLLEELLEGIEENSRTYNGELIVEERQKYINQLQTSLKAGSDSTDKSMVGEWKKRIKEANDRGDVWSREMIMQGARTVAGLGNERDKFEFQTQLGQMATAEAVFSSDTATTDTYLQQLKEKAGNSLADSARYSAAQRAAEQKRKQVKADPVRYMQEHGPMTDAKRAAMEAGDFAPTDLFTKDPMEVRQLLDSRRIAMNEAAGLFGADEHLLTKAEAGALRNSFAFGSVEEQMQIAGAIADLGPDNATTLFNQLSMDSSVKGYALPAAGQALSMGDMEGATMVIRSANMADDPIQRTVASDRDLISQLNTMLGPGLVGTYGTDGASNFKKAVLNLYAYQVGINGQDPRNVDTELLQSSIDLITGGQRTGVGATRVRPAGGLDVEQFNRVLRTGSDEFWQEKIDEADMRFSHGMSAMVNGTGLGQQIRDGRAWLVEALDGSDGYYVQTWQDLQGGIMKEPRFITDATGELMTLHFDVDDYTPTQTRSNVGRSGR